MLNTNKIYRRKVFLATICCREKDRATGLLPAFRRYRSERIDRISELAAAVGSPFAILSGLYGLIDSLEPIPYYDRLMSEDDVNRIALANAEFLKKRQVAGVVFCLPDPSLDPHVRPYLRSMEEAASAAGCRLKVFFLPPYPGPEEIADAFGRGDFPLTG